MTQCHKMTEGIRTGGGQQFALFRGGTNMFPVKYLMFDDTEQGQGLSPRRGVDIPQTRNTYLGQLPVKLVIIEDTLGAPDI